MESRVGGVGAFFADCGFRTFFGFFSELVDSEERERGEASAPTDGSFTDGSII